MTPRRPIWTHERHAAESTIDPRDEIRQAYRELFNTPLGQKVLNDIIRMANTGLPIEEGIDPERAVWIVARQSLVQGIVNRTQQED